MRRMYDENQIKEIAGAASGGKLYRHNIEITGAAVPWEDVTAYITITSSSKLNVDSLTDLKTLLGSTFSYPATGYDGYNLAYIYRITETNVFSTDKDGGIHTVSFANMTVITDSIKEI